MEIRPFRRDRRPKFAHLTPHQLRCRIRVEIGGQRFFDQAKEIGELTGSFGEKIQLGSIMMFLKSGTAMDGDKRFKYAFFLNENSKTIVLTIWDINDWKEFVERAVSSKK